MLTSGEKDTGEVQLKVDKLVTVVEVVVSKDAASSSGQ